VRGVVITRQLEEGGKLASAHTVNAPRLRITRQAQPDVRFAGAGSYLRTWYGRQYLSMGFTFDHGSVSGGPGQAIAMPPPLTPIWSAAPWPTGSTSSSTAGR
jgi:hypothetical protein